MCSTAYNYYLPNQYLNHHDEYCERRCFHNKHNPTITSYPRTYPTHGPSHGWLYQNQPVKPRNRKIQYRQSGHNPMGHRQIYDQPQAISQPNFSTPASSIPLLNTILKEILHESVYHRNCHHPNSNLAYINNPHPTANNTDRHQIRSSYLLPQINKHDSINITLPRRSSYERIRNPKQ